MTEKTDKAPTIKDAEAPDNALEFERATDIPENGIDNPDLARADQEADKSDESMIVHRERYIDGNGVQQEKVHGPMPISEWPAYAAKNGF